MLLKKQSEHPATRCTGQLMLMVDHTGLRNPHEGLPSARIALFALINCATLRASHAPRMIGSVKSSPSVLTTRNPGSHPQAHRLFPLDTSRWARRGQSANLLATHRYCGTLGDQLHRQLVGEDHRWIIDASHASQIGTDNEHLLASSLSSMFKYILLYIALWHGVPPIDRGSVI